jgi:selenide,water dikinase
MGGQPLWALNLVFFPDDKLPLSVLRRIMDGARQKCAEAKVAIVGGHTVRNGDLKFGLAVTGMLDPGQRRPLANTRALPGQLLVLSKALGSAIKRGAANEAEIAAATASMVQLNDKAAEFAREHGATACTDVTGFGLLGHLRNILRGSRLQARIDLHRLPLLPGAMRLLEAGFYPGGSKSNLEHVDRSLLRRYSSNDKDAIACTMLAADAQTSGGLLSCLRPEEAERVLEQLRASGHRSAIIGELLPAKPSEIGHIELRSGR